MQHRKWTIHSAAFWYVRDRRKKRINSFKAREVIDSLDVFIAELIWWLRNQQCEAYSCCGENNRGSSHPVSGYQAKRVRAWSGGIGGSRRGIPGMRLQVFSRWSPASGGLSGQWVSDKALRRLGNRRKWKAVSSLLQRRLSQQSVSSGVDKLEVVCCFSCCFNSCSHNTFGVLCWSCHERCWIDRIVFLRVYFWTAPCSEEMHCNISTIWNNCLLSMTLEQAPPVRNELNPSQCVEVIERSSIKYSVPVSKTTGRTMYQFRTVRHFSPCWIIVHIFPRRIQPVYVWVSIEKTSDIQCSNKTSNFYNECTTYRQDLQLVIIIFMFHRWFRRSVHKTRIYELLDNSSPSNRQQKTWRTRTLPSGTLEVSVVEFRHLSLGHLITRIIKMFAA